MARDLPHVFLRDWAETQSYTSHAAGGGSGAPRREPASHGASLRTAFDTAAETARERRAESVRELAQDEPDGVYLTFESFPGIEHALASLEDRRDPRPAELVAVRDEPDSDGSVQLATVWIPDDAIGTFVRKLEEYVEEVTPSGNPRHRKLWDRVRDVRMATLDALWTEPGTAFPPDDEAIWWEVWLRRHDGEELERFRTFLEQSEAVVSARALAFTDRIVTVVHATPTQLESGIARFDDLAELRQAPRLNELFTGMQPAEQRDWIDDLIDRAAFPSSDAPAVCVLDTGVRAGHPLLEPALHPDDVHTYDPAWGSADDRGHGTAMAGLALFGDELADALGSKSPVTLRHRLESVKMLPPPPRQSDPDQYGAIMAASIARAEIQRPDRPRAVSMAVSAALPRAGGPQYGTPTSWSSAVDALAAGRSIAQRADGLTYLDEREDRASRLIVVSAGNVEKTGWDREHLSRSDVEPIDDPGQAWNALTVGAMTELTDTSPLGGWDSVAPDGELSPHSRTSVAFATPWPQKPDVVFEGGNVAVSPSDDFDTPVGMQLLTTHGGRGTRLLTVANATSAATAQAARMAAQVWADDPELWPETVRALIVHGARWTPAMQSHFDAATKKGDREALLRRYGYGIPTLDRVLHSANNELTLVAEGVIHPFKDGSMRELHSYDLPWPTDVLEGLGETEVRLRVTLSHFIEPNPSRRGWAGRFRYASHGLRFGVKFATESDTEFHKRINKLALEKGEKKPTGSDSDEWFLGSNAVGRGSLHSDVWTGTAADLATRGGVIVYPVTGWWKELKQRDRSDRGVRYALVISIEAPEVDVDLYTPVAAQLELPIEAEVTT